MINFEKIESIQQKFLEELKDCQDSINTQMNQEKKNFKVEQAEKIKEIILISDNSVEVKKHLSDFIKELDQKNVKIDRELKLRIEKITNNYILNLTKTIESMFSEKRKIEENKETLNEEDLSQSINEESNNSENSVEEKQLEEWVAEIKNLI